MSRIDWACLAAFVIGFLLFLYGANAYNAVAGSLGIVLFVGAIIVYILKYIYKELTKTPVAPVPAQTP